MANPLQQASVRRKVIYLGLILGLFTVSLFWRGKFAIPLRDQQRVVALNEARRGTPPAGGVPAATSPVHAVADWLSARSIAEQAKPDALDLRELDQGDPEIAGSLARLSLVGSRGFVITGLWRAAIEKQKRNEWHEFEALVRMVTRLQPNFITPWIYQSWNIAYNVSVENDRLNDMYFYIARGIELLAEGERLNKNSPDMRYQIGFYYQNKFGVSDKVTTLRSLMQVSCIKPGDRDPDRFKNPTDGTVRMADFQEFCRQNPQLVRRLREKLGYTRPEQIVRFLEENRQVPTRFNKDKNDQLLPAREQFPALPAADPPLPDEPNPRQDADRINDTFDAFLAARAWYEYALRVVPPPSPVPAATPRLEGEDRFKYRIPKSPMLIIFRQGAPRAQTYYAERLSKEGWFDRQTAWDPDERADTGDQFWFPGEPKEKRSLPTGTSSQNEWDRAYTRWKRHGDENGLNLDQAQLTNYAREAQGVPPSFNLGWLDMSDGELTALGVTRQQVRARAILTYYDQNRNVTNFPFFLESANAERDPLVIAARKTIWDAERAKDAGDKVRAIDLYAEGLAQWRQALLQFPRYHRNDRTSKAEEDTYEYTLELARLLAGSPQVDALAQKQAVAARVLIPGVDEGELKVDLARELAEREAGFRVVKTNPELQQRVDQILRENKEKNGALEATWPQIKEGRDALVRAVYDKEFAWMAEYTDRNLRDDTTRWVSMGTQQSVRERMGFKRREPAPPAAQPAAEPGK